MDLILTVFDALRSFDGGATRVQLERESGLDKRAVEHGLAGLMRRDLLCVAGAPRATTTYRLIEGAPRPEITLRGRYARRASSLSASNVYSVARPPSHDAQPGALRTTVRNIQARRAFAPCVLAQVWQKALTS